MTKSGKKTLLIGVFAVIIFGVYAFIVIDPISRYRNWHADQVQNEVLSSFSAETPKIEEPIAEKRDEPKETKEIIIKDKVNLDVQFIPQGPLEAGGAHWDIHAESCEEAASLMAHNFIVGKTTSMPDAEKDIFSLVDWQIENFGDEHDIYPDEVKELIQGYWGHKDVLVIKNATIKDLKEQMSQGYPVIVPTIAAYLNNPRYYDQEYHMVLAKGYTSDSVIVHDNGTTWGADYIYSYETFQKALDAAGGSVVVIRK